MPLSFNRSTKASAVFATTVCFDSRNPRAGIKFFPKTAHFFGLRLHDSFRSTISNAFFITGRHSRMNASFAIVECRPATRRIKPIHNHAQNEPTLYHYPVLNEPPARRSLVGPCSPSAFNYCDIVLCGHKTESCSSDSSTPAIAFIPDSGSVRRARVEADPVDLDQVSISHRDMACR